jgi:hypothetical protein
MSKAMITVKRYLLLVIGFCIAISVITPCELYPGDEETAENLIIKPVKQSTVISMIVHWSQTYYGVMKFWGKVEIAYLVINTSSYGIRGNIKFKATCESGNVYTVSHFESDIPEGYEKLVTAYIDTHGERATDVIIQDFTVEGY